MSPRPLPDSQPPAVSRTQFPAARGVVATVLQGYGLHRNPMTLPLEMLCTGVLTNT